MCGLQLNMRKVIFKGLSSLTRDKVTSWRKQKQHSQQIKPLLYIAEVAVVLLMLPVNWLMPGTSA